MRIGKFFVAIGQDWLARMSGPLTVPFTVAALFVSASSYRYLFAVLAIVAYAVTCYRLWAHGDEELQKADTVIAKYRERAEALTWISHFADEGTALAVGAPNEDATTMEVARWRQSVETWRNTTTDALLSLSIVAKEKFFDFDAGWEPREFAYEGKHQALLSDLTLLEEKRRNLREIMEKADVYLAKVI
jgi:hypothetical protein